jgi:acetyltransferase-like isoleucine patch superfamily enzyme
MGLIEKPPFVDPLTLFPRALTKLHTFWLRLTYPFASVGRNLSIHFTSEIARQRSSRISLGNSVTLYKRVRLNVADDFPTGDPTIVIDDNCYIGADSIISAKNLIHIEHDVLVAQSVLIQDHNHAYEDVTRPIVEQGITEGGRIRIGQGSWIGHGAAIVCNQKELVLGRNCVVAANALVTRSFPPYSVIVGNPARLGRQFDPVMQTWSGQGWMRGEKVFGK